MSGAVEFGKCEICGNDSPLERTYFHYDIKCECHSPRHFEMFRHCSQCIPKEPVETKVIIKTSILKNQILPNDAHSVDVFAIKYSEDSPTGKEAFIGYKNNRNDFNFIGVPFTEPK